MRNLTGVVVVLTLAALVLPAAAGAQCVTPKRKLAPALTAKAAYAAARAEAVRWNADSALIRMQSTMAGPLDAMGQSANWMLEFYSKSTKKLDVLNIMKGELVCSAAAVEVLAAPVEVTPDTILDTQRLYATALDAGGAAQVAKQATVSARLEQTADAVAVWTVGYATSQGMPLLAIKIDAKTGLVVAKPHK